MEVLNTKQNVFQTGKSVMASMTVLMGRMKIAVFVVSFRSNRALPSKLFYWLYFSVDKCCLDEWIN